MTGHILMAMTNAGGSPVEASQNPIPQDIAWSPEGFRSGSSVTGGPSILSVSGLPGAIDKGEPMPPFGVGEQLLNAIGQMQG